MIIFSDVHKQYNSTFALRNINLKIQDSEFVSITGRSGAGKSTIIKLLIGEEKPNKGEIFVDNENINRLSSSMISLYRRKIGIIFQDFKLLARKTAFENIAFAMEVAGVPFKQIQSDVMKILQIVGLENKKDQFPHQLSGGEKQRVAIGRAIALRPKILVADEPTGNLDPVHSWEIINLLIKINQLNTTVILATHDKEIINSLSKRVITLENGAIINDELQGKYLLA